MNPRQHELSTLLNRYVPLDYDSITQHGALRPPQKLFMRTTTNFRKTGYSTLSSPGASPSITHEDVLYSSLEASYGVLNANRTTYIKMMSTLHKMEKEEFDNTYSSVCAYKKKLDYFKAHRKANQFRHCNPSQTIISP